MTSSKPDDNPGGYGERQMWKVTIAAPIDTVWSILTKTDEVLPFLFGAKCQTESGLKPGKPMRMVSGNGKVATVVGTVLEFSPPYRFSHTTSFTQVEGEPAARTTYELREVPGGTELTLSSEAIPETKTGKMVKAGPFIVNNLKALAETGKPAFSGAMVLTLSPLMNLFASPRSRIENWPLTQDRA